MIDIHEKICCVCGRRFVPAAQHILRIGNRWACKPTCYLALQRQEAEKVDLRRTKKKKEEREA